MKKRLFALFISITLCTLCSCSKTKADTYFIHACAFEKVGDLYTVHALTEKHSEKDEDYLVISQSAKTISDAAQKLKVKYRDCYFATTEVYFISEESVRHIDSIAKEICQSNTYPSKSQIIYTDTDAKVLLELIKTEEDLNRVLRLSESKSTNAVKLFSRYLGKSSVLLPSFGIEKGNSITFTGEKEIQPKKE